MAYKVGTTEIANNSAQVLSSQLSGALPALDGSALTGTGHGTRTFMIWHNSHWSVVNGGCCLAWTVPADTETIQFELVGAGGPGGSSAGDYEITFGGQGGGYVAKTVCSEGGQFTPGGSTYTLCAGGTSQCSCCCHCCMATRQGCTTWVQGDGLSNLCAVGGLGGSTPWDKMSSCYNCHMGGIQCCAPNYDSTWMTQTVHTQWYGGDYGFTGTSGSYDRKYDCCSDVKGWAGGPTGPFAVSGTVNGGQACTQCSGCRGGHSSFPGGGGVGHPTASGSACWGGWGAGGLVRITYS